MRCLTCLFALAAAIPGELAADGKLQRPRDYVGSLEEKGQEAIIVYREKNGAEPAMEDMILKIRVGPEPPPSFAWIIAFPNPPKTTPADKVLFEEIFNYVEAQKKRVIRLERGGKTGLSIRGVDRGVTVISRETVGSFEVTVVKEETEGKLNGWLEQNGYEPLRGANRILEHYRQKDFVFACIKVTNAARESAGDAKGLDLHPLAFRFDPGSSRAVYFPMILTGLQKDPVTVSLYVFTPWLLNDRLNEFGFSHYKFSSEYQNGKPGRSRPGDAPVFSEVHADPRTKTNAHRMPTLQAWFREHHRGRSLFLTKLTAKDLDAFQLRLRDNDLWLFPYSKAIPEDAREGGVAYSRRYR